MTNEQQPRDPIDLPAPVTGVARGGQGTGTALDDTQVYDVADFTAATNEAVTGPATPEPEAGRPAPAHPAPEPPAAVVAPAPQAAPRVAPRRRTSNDRKPRVGAPVAGLVGFAIAAGLAILIGASLGGMTDRGSANGEATFQPPATGFPAETEAPDGDDGDEDGGGGNGGNGNGNGNNGNGNGRGNGNDD